MKSKSVLGWHFTGETLRDGRPIPMVGEWLVYEGEVAMCASGLHASRKLFDALGLAPGMTLHRVECADVVEEGGDKLVCRRRRILATIGTDRMSQILRRFARICAYTVIDQWDAPEIVRRYLETGDESIRAAAKDAAKDAAWGAAKDAAWAAAWAAAWDAAWDAARGAAWDAARGAAWDAAKAATRAATWAATCAAAKDAAWGAAKAATRAATWAAAKDAAWAAAKDAAKDATWAATWAAYNSELERIVLCEMGLSR